MYIAQKYNLINDLSNILINNYNQLGVNYLFCQCEDFYSEEIFDPHSLLVMFLYNKQKYLNLFCSQILKNNTYIELLFDKKDCFNSKKNFESGYIFVNLNVKHNIKKIEDYHKTLKFMALLIITDNSLRISNNIINIDKIYQQFIQNFEKNIFGEKGITV